MFHFFRKYHYVPPCPKCGSYKTGRFYYVSTTFQKIERMIAENMRYGELSRIEVGFGDELEHNAYCEECGVQWRANIEELPLTDERILEEMKRRGITQTGIKFIKSGNIGESVEKSEFVGKDLTGSSTTFYGDVVDIPEEKADMKY